MKIHSQIAIEELCACRRDIDANITPVWRALPRARAVLHKPHAETRIAAMKLFEGFPV
jgi:hypothetical protein